MDGSRCFRLFFWKKSPDLQKRMIKSPEKEIDMILEKNENFVINESMIPPEMSVTIDNARELAREFRDLRMRYHAAIKEISTKLEVLDNEFSVRNDYNPIHHMQWVVCNYIDDIYTVEESLLRQDDIKLLKRKDYIKNPKESGYRSLHLLVEVPIFLSDRTYNMPVEIQIRTIAMDTWASLEHELKYKSKKEMPGYVVQELKNCAKSMADLDASMERIHKML